MSTQLPEDIDLDELLGRARQLLAPVVGHFPRGWDRMFALVASSVSMAMSLDDAIEISGIAPELRDTRELNECLDQAVAHLALLSVADRDSWDMDLVELSQDMLRMLSAEVNVRLEEMRAGGSVCLSVPRPRQ